MLRASSLGLIYSSSHRIFLKQCPTLPHSRLSHMIAARTHSEHEHGDVRDLPPHVHASNAVEQPVQDPKNADSLQKNPPENSPPIFYALARHMLDRERKAWEAEKKQEGMYIREELPYVTGKSRYAQPVKPLYGGKFKRGSSYKKPDNSISFEYLQNGHSDGVEAFIANALREKMPDKDVYYHCCHIIANTQSVEDAWIAYSTILHFTIPRDPPIPFEHLHRLCRLLAQNVPKTRTQFLRVLSVLYTIRKHGGRIHQFEWNALISNAGSGWRRSRAKDFQLALDIFEDMISGNPPGSTFSSNDYPILDIPSQPVDPDAFTYDTLIGIAAKTLLGRAIARASAMLRSSGHPPTRITHLSLLIYFSSTRQLSGVHSTLLKMRQQNLELGLDGVNACIWAYGRGGKLHRVESIYRVLRHNIHPEPEQVIRPIIEGLKEAFIEISPLMTPNAITYCTVIQIMAWNGNFSRTYDVLMEMLTSINMERGAPLVRGEDGEIHYTTYTAVYTSFRSLFLGFSRHGVQDIPSQLPRFHVQQDGDRKWTISNLQTIFDTFISLPEPIAPSWGMVYWIMGAFDRTSGHDVELMRKVWLQLEERYPGPWGGPKHRLRVLREILFSRDAEAHLKKYGFHTAKQVRSRDARFTYDFHNKPDSY